MVDANPPKGDTMTCRVETRWRKGHYCARLTGPDPKYGLRRDFEKGEPVKSRGMLRFDLNPGWYELGEGWQRPRRYVAVDELTVTEIPAEMAGAMDRISGGPNPGEPGSWGDSRRKCGADVEYFDEDGLPYCAEHWQA